MVKEVRIYIEGGGDSRDTKRRLREGFSVFLKDLREVARQRRIGWSIIMCGSRQSAFADFKTAVLTHPDAFNVLLVDAEDAVNSEPWKHLQIRDAWDGGNIADEHCHLMVQVMESWFLADKDALNSYYGQHLYRNALPRNSNVEEISKADVARALENATRQTKKGCYEKIRHASELLELINVARVRDAAPHCERLFTTLLQKMRGEES